MLRYNLRTLLILLALGPPVLASLIQEYRGYLARQHLMEQNQAYCDYVPLGARVRWHRIK